MAIASVSGCRAQWLRGLDGRHWTPRLRRPWTRWRWKTVETCRSRWQSRCPSTSETSPVRRTVCASRYIHLWTIFITYQRASLSGLVASGAVYFGQLDRRSRRTSAYVTTRAFVPFVGPVYVTTGSIRAVQWSGSHDLSTCGRTLARWAIELWSISHDLGEDYKRKGRTWERGEK